MLLILRHPEVAFRDCDHCQQFVYDEKTGKPERWRKGTPDERLLERTTPPPCHYVLPDGKSKCPKGSPHAGLALTEANYEAYDHYLQCRATGAFPDDPIVRRNAAVIRDVEDSVSEQRQHEQLIELFEVVLKARM